MTPISLLPISPVCGIPTYVAILRKSPHADAARRFIHYLLSPKGQRILADANTGKYPVTPLAADNPRATQQQLLMNQPR